MITKLKNIEFVFENCDVLTIDGKYIGYFLVDDLKTKFARMACNCIGKMEKANIIAIEIHKDANKERYEFGQSQIDEFKQMAFDRFKGNDITSIEFELEEQYVDDGQTPHIEHYSYYVDWVGDNDYVNEAQSTYISNDGHLYLVIAENKSIEDFFNLKEINDSEYIDYCFDMCDVGDKYSNPDRYNSED